MDWNLMFFVNSVLLGVGLAMDAFSVSIANGLGNPKMKERQVFGIAGTYAFFQIAMPLIGWICVHTIVHFFNKFEKFVPYIALILLVYIGGKMIIECIKGNKEETKKEEIKKLSFGLLMVQGIATSIDALSVGFTIEAYGFVMALVSSLIIGITTFFICFAGVNIGKKFGNKFDKAEIVGGVILICIGIEIFVKGIIA